MPLKYPVVPHFYYNSLIEKYSFGPKHPLKPERVDRTLRLLNAIAPVEVIDVPSATREDALRCHDEDYIDAIQSFSEIWEGEDALTDDQQLIRHEFGLYGDDPPFRGMYEASLGYLGATVAAANAVKDGANLAFAITGGLHHAQRRLASGFCIFDDPAIACDILLDRFDRVAYVDIDVHAGDGVQWIHYDNPRVLTCSIHEEGKTLYPGTCWPEETGTEFSSLNVPIQAHTTGDVWLDAFRQGILPGLEKYQPQAIVLQLGTDTHHLDPLGHINSTAQEWLAAVTDIKALGLPIVATGGGGYNLTTVPRMWVAAILTLANIPFQNEIPEHLQQPLGAKTIFDDALPEPRNTGRPYAESVISWLKTNHHPNIRP